MSPGLEPEVQSQGEVGSWPLGLAHHPPCQLSPCPLGFQHFSHWQPLVQGSRLSPAEERGGQSGCDQPSGPADPFHELPASPFLGPPSLLGATLPTATHLLTLPIEVHKRVAGLGDIRHSHPLIHSIDMEVQPPRAVQPQSQDGAFWTCVQIRPKFLTDLGGKTYCLQGDQTPHWQQPPPPFTKLRQPVPGFCLYPCPLLQLSKVHLPFLPL